jgi:hypothetical protein
MVDREMGRFVAKSSFRPSPVSIELEKDIFDRHIEPPRVVGSKKNFDRDRRKVSPWL